MKKNSLVFIAIMAGCVTSLTACSDGQKDVSKDYIQSHHSIMNGSKDTKTSHNAVVALYTSASGEAFCTGTLIHPQWVLTAGHCVATDSGKLDTTVKKTTEIGIGAGEKKFTSNYAIDTIYLHEQYGDRYIGSGYSKYTLDGDMALIKLSKSVPSSAAEPILPHPSWLALNNTDLPMDMEFSGFGYTEDGGLGTKLAYTGPVKSVCRVSDSCVIGKGYCKKDSFKVNGCHPADYYNGKCSEPVNETDNVYAPCGSFYYTQEEGGPCNGDSGGPMFDTIGGREYVNGVTSYGDRVCAYYGISTSVQDYYDWIIAKAPEVATQYTEICGNGLDDDGDGKIDDKDEDCGGSATTPVCGDGIINQNSEQCDGTIFNIGSSDCSAYNSKYASGKLTCTSSCQIDVSACKEKATDSSKEICNDGIDNDGDGFIDCKDYDCNYDEACAEICDDGIDNDGDGHIDCKDYYCKNDPICTGSNTDPASCNVDTYANSCNGKTLTYCEEGNVVNSTCDDGSYCKINAATNDGDCVELCDASQNGQLLGYYCYDIGSDTYAFPLVCSAATDGSYASFLDVDKYELCTSGCSEETGCTGSDSNSSTCSTDSYVDSCSGKTLTYCNDGGVDELTCDDGSYCKINAANNDGDCVELCDANQNGQLLGYICTDVGSDTYAIPLVCSAATDGSYASFVDIDDYALCANGCSEETGCLSSTVNDSAWEDCSSEECSLDDGTTMTCGKACETYVGSGLTAWCDANGNVDCREVQPTEAAEPEYENCSAQTCTLGSTALTCGSACVQYYGDGNNAWCDKAGNIFCSKTDPNAETSGNTNRFDVDGDTPVEVCNDFIDNNYDGLIDCDDPTCANTLACAPAKAADANSSSSTTNTGNANSSPKGSSDSCSATPLTNGSNPAPLAAGIFGLFGLFGLSLRRRSQK